MNFEEFKTDALRTESKPEKLNFSREGLYLLLDAGTKMANIMDTAKKTMFYGKPLNKQYLNQELENLFVLLDKLHRMNDADSIGVPGQCLAKHWEPNLRIAHGAIGMFTEAGELLEAVKSEMETGNIDMVNLAEETGDSDWYKAIIHDETGISEELSRGKVIAKLKARYGEKFSSERALTRDLATERKVLEGESA